MADPGMRVALLARPGAACENLQVALRQAGADIVLVVDPTGSDAGSVAASSPQAVLVALEPSVEEVLDRYDEILLDPATTVIYDEVVVAAHREGWDAARWSRHLAAKLGGHRDVLPPGADIDIEGFPVARTIAKPANPAPAPTGLSLADDFGELHLGVDGLEPAAPATPRFSMDEMALVDTELAHVPVADAIEASAPSLGPVDDDQGAVIVLAGIGGPDAVRHFLAALPVGFARPIIVRQRLDGGRHDRLVRQMQRATSLPVELAQAGATLVEGHVYILPDGMTTTQAAGVITFNATDAVVPVLAGLPAADSAILVLSGSDLATVPEVVAAAGAGALAVAQAPEECFDSAAPMALIAAGIAFSPPDQLARRLNSRWLSLKD